MVGGDTLSKLDVCGTTRLDIVVIGDWELVVVIGNMIVSVVSSEMDVVVGRRVVEGAVGVVVRDDGGFVGSIIEN